MSEDEPEEELEDDDELEEEELEDDESNRDEVAPVGNRVSGARARAAVDHIARHLVDDPDGVFVDANERGDTVALLIHASPGDLGRIIGKRGWRSAASAGPMGCTARSPSPRSRIAPSDSRRDRGCSSTTARSWS